MITDLINRSFITWLIDYFTLVNGFDWCCRSCYLILTFLVGVANPRYFGAVIMVSQPIVNWNLSFCIEPNAIVLACICMRACEIKERQQRTPLDLLWLRLTFSTSLIEGCVLLWSTRWDFWWDSGNSIFKKRF